MKMNYHGPVTISAYIDINGIPSSIKRALSCTEVEDVSDKKIFGCTCYFGQWTILYLGIILGMLLDNPVPANYLLISGDRYFSNVIHQLQMRRYDILPPNLLKLLLLLLLPPQICRNGQF